jgi:hypothetical protein
MLCLFRKTALFIVLLLLTGCAASAIDSAPKLQVGTTQDPIEIRGVLQEDLQLGGVIRLTGDLLIPAERSLLIAPGSRILVLGNDSTKIDPEFLDKGTEIIVRGSLTIAGQATAAVTLTLDEATPPGENWAGIELIAAESVSLSHVDILAAEIGILSLDSRMQLTQVNILGSRYGILLQGGGHLDYRGGRIGGGDAGLLCFDQSALELDRLSILDNVEEGLYLAKGCSLQAHELRIERNDLGAVASNNYRTVLQPALRDNRIDFKSLDPETLQ